MFSFNIVVSTFVNNDKRSYLLEIFLGKELIFADVQTDTDYIGYNIRQVIQDLLASKFPSVESEQ